MDLSETQGEVLNRHPWELSRTRCVMSSFSPYLDRLKKQKGYKRYINAGAGDLYFDKALLRKYKKTKVYAIDIAYKDTDSQDARIQKYHYLEEIEQEGVDYAIMMDSLEYMEDDVAYIRKMASKIRKGGYFFFTLPAYPVLFSDYDINIRNLRRYSSKSFAEVLSKVPELEKIEEHNFYLSLFMVRGIQKLLHLPIDPNHNFTANWKYPKNHALTMVLTGILDLDYIVCKFLSRIGIKLPGLSMLVICKKTV